MAKFVKEPRVPGESIRLQVCVHEGCSEKPRKEGEPVYAHFSPHCGVFICGGCGEHEGLARCFCGWSLTSPGNGYRELIEMGERIEDDY